MFLSEMSTLIEVTVTFIIASSSLFLTADSRSILLQRVVRNAPSNSLLPNPSTPLFNQIPEAYPMAPRDGDDDDDRHQNHFSSLGNCPVVPDTAVIVNDNPTYFDFDWNEPFPAGHSNQTLKCPAKQLVQSWWPAGPSDPEENMPHLRASCPWIWKTVNLHLSGFEIYPKYAKVAQCLCKTCVNAASMGCKQLKQTQTFYRKVGCDNGNPVFEKGTLKIAVGCYCAS